MMLFLFPNATKAQDIKLKIPKSSIDNMLSAFIKAKYFSYGTTDLGAFVQYYSLKPYSATINIQPGNIFSLTIVSNFTANINLTIFDFDYVINNISATLSGVIQLDDYEGGYKIIFIPNSITSSGGGIFSSVINVASSGLIDQLPELSVNINQPLLPVICGQYFTSPTPTLSTNANGIELSLTLKEGPRYITVFNDVDQNANIGFIENEEGANNFISYQSPKTFEWTTGTVKKIQTPIDMLDASNGKNKYRGWFKGKNYNPESEIASRRIQLTVGALDETYKAKFEKAQRVQISNLLEGNSTGGTVTYESISATALDFYDFYNDLQNHPINSSVPNGTLGRNWFFSGWSDGNTNQSRTIKVNGDLNLKANYKASQLSSDAAAYTNNSQRKIVKTADGWLHQVYQSMGHVFIEHSTNNGTSWFIGNNGQPLV